MSPRTLQHLTAAMKAEAFSSAICSRFAAHARMNDQHELAALLQRAADDDRCEHFQKEFTLARLIGSDLENLSATVDETSRRIETYSRFEVEASSDGDADAANFLANLRTDELRQLELLQVPLRELKAAPLVTAAP